MMRPTHLATSLRDHPAAAAAAIAATAALAERYADEPFGSCLEDLHAACEADVAALEELAASWDIQLETDVLASSAGGSLDDELEEIAVFIARKRLLWRLLSMTPGCADALDEPAWDALIDAAARQRRDLEAIRLEAQADQDNARILSQYVARQSASTAGMSAFGTPR
jgi:hypothetical protein